MSIYYWEKLTFFKLHFSKFKKIVTRSVFRKPQPTQISFNFQTSCCNFKIRGLRAKLYCERNYDVLKSKNPCILLNKNVNFKNETELKMKNPTHNFRETNLSLCFSWYKNRKLKVKLWWVGEKERKKRAFFCTVYFVRRNLF